MISNTHISYRKLFNLLKGNNYTLSAFKIDHFKSEYPENYLMHPSLQKKTHSYQNVFQCSWEIESTFHQSCSLLIYSKDKVELSEKQIKTLIDMLSFVLSLNQKNDHVKIHFIPLKDKKQIHKNQYQLTSKNVNSGSYRRNEIFVYRYEECLKVLLHECIHHLHFTDTSLFSEDLTDFYIQKYALNVHKININEAYTEIFARLFYCFYLSNQSYQRFLSLLRTESSFAQYQANKILLLNEKTNVNKNTNTIAYYVIVAELFHNLHPFLQFCFRNNPTFYLSERDKFNEMIFSLKKIKNKKILKHQKNYATMKMTSSSHPHFP